MKLNRSPGLLIIVGGGFLMFIDTLLAWQSINVGGLTFSRNAWHGLFGFLIGLLSIAFLVNAVIYTGIVEVKTRLPHKILAISLAPAILVLSVIKNLDDSHSDWASYVGIVIAALITWGAWMVWNEKPSADAPAGSLPPSTPSAAPSEPAASPAAPPPKDS